MYMEELLQLVFDRDGSDLHISSGVPPIIRINGKLVRTDYDPLSPEDTQRLIFSILSNDQRKNLEQTAQALEAKTNESNELGTRVAALEAAQKELMEDNHSIAARLVTAQIRRLEAEKLLLETRIEIERIKAEEAAQAAQAQAKSAGNRAGGKAKAPASRADERAKEDDGGRE
jgi:Tfp pilus assembly pilus retraction ATPase PilT